MISLLPALIGILFCSTFGLGLAVVSLYQTRKQERAKFQALIDCVPCSISWISDDETYIAANQELANLLNVKTNDFIGKKVGFLGGKRIYTDFVRNFFHQAKSSQRFEFQVERDGKKRDILSLAQKYNKNREAVIIGVDITEQKEAQRIVVDQQQALVASEKLSSLGEMSATIARDMNSPLREITAHTDHLREILDSSSTSEQDHERMATEIANIEATVERISKTVGGLITFSRDTSQDSLETSSIRDIVEETLELCRYRLHNSGIRILTEDINPSLQITCRKIQLQQALLNLINNSHDAILQLDEKWIQVSANQEQGIVKISITDSGKGIPAEIEDKITQPFFSTKSPGKGTGLGLSIVQRVVDSHKGTFRLNKDSIHTNFLIEIPKKSA